MVLLFNILMKKMNVLHSVQMKNYVQLYHQIKILLHSKSSLLSINRKIHLIKNVILALNVMVVKVQLLVFDLNVLYVQIMIYVKNVHQPVFIQNII
jgi:hypothetical protein